MDKLVSTKQRLLDGQPLLDIIEYGSGHNGLICDSIENTAVTQHIKYRHYLWLNLVYWIENLNFESRIWLSFRLILSLYEQVNLN